MADGFLQRFSDLWLRIFYWWTRYGPWGPPLTGPIWVEGAWLISAPLRDATLTNARRLLGPDSTARQRLKLARRIHGDFFDFVCQVGASQDQNLEQLTARIDDIEGAQRYNAARAQKRGAVLVTAHFGNFEVGMAAVRQREAEVHVVFQRDVMDRFEQVRAALRRNLGVTETPIDEGMTSWLTLRDALARDAVVMLQGDRTMPGQKGEAVAFFDGHLRMPVGPAKLAMMSGSPLIAVFAIHSGRGKVRIVLGEPIEVPDAAAIQPAMQRVAGAMETMIRRYPEQWHVLQRAWIEDAG